MYFIDITNIRSTYNIRYAHGVNEEAAIKDGVMKLLPKLADDISSMELGYKPSVIEDALDGGHDIDFIVRQGESKSPILNLWKSDVTLVQCKPLFKGKAYLSVEKVIYNPKANDIIKNCILLVRPAAYISWFAAQQKLMKEVITTREQTIGDILYLYKNMMTSALLGDTFSRFVNMYNNVLNLLPVFALKDNAGNLKFGGISIVRKPWSMFPLQFNISTISKVEAIELLKLIRLFVNTTDVNELVSYFNLDEYRVNI